MSKSGSHEQDGNGFTVLGLVDRLYADLSQKRGLCGEDMPFLEVMNRPFQMGRLTLQGGFLLNASRTSTY